MLIRREFYSTKNEGCFKDNVPKLRSQTFGSQFLKPKMYVKVENFQRSGLVTA